MSEMTSTVSAAASPAPTARRVPGLPWLFGLSVLVNLLFLTGPLFMMQVYDRVLPSGSLSTLVGLFAIVVLLFLAFGAFDYLRQQIAILRAEEIAARYDLAAAKVSIEAASSRIADARAQAPEDLETVRGFLSSPGLIALFDAPAMPLFLLVITLLHPLLGIIAVVSGILLTILAIANERLTREHLRSAQKNLSLSNRVLVLARQDADSIQANSMSDAVGEHWISEQSGPRTELVSALRRTSLFTTVTKALRLAIQSFVLAAGAALAINKAISPGSMVAASIIFARSIAPLEQILGAWKPLLNARDAWRRIQEWAPGQLQSHEKFALPLPRNTIVAKALSATPPGRDRPIVRDVTFVLKAGDVLAICGASGAGKTSLLKAVTGIWPAKQGALVFDGADPSLWPGQTRQKVIGYLGQAVELGAGTVAQIISRFNGDAEHADILEAAKAAGIHELITSLPDGYDTRIGAGGLILSGGQTQRIGLARAMMFNPFLLVLDEPAAHLDRLGEAALARAVRARQSAGKITIFTTHDEKLLALATHMLVLENGEMKVSGPKQAVLSRMRGAAAAPAAPAAPGESRGH